ncbi:hypothetical protein M5689_019315 [Euphorbia peplus]|nr:hypothetical protein M5689_019315 [Euphorbia peplus]
MEMHDILGEEIEEEEIEEDMEMELYENVKFLMSTIVAVITLLRKIIVMPRRIEHSLKRRPITRIGYNFIHNMIKGDPQDFRELHRMYPDAFLKLCTIIREKTLLEDTRYMCVEEIVATFLLVVGHNDRYCNVRQRCRSHFATSQNFNKTLKALNTIAPEMMVKPSIGIPAKIRESTRFNPFFKDCIGAIDGTHIPAMVQVQDVSSYRNRHGFQSQNVLAACNFDLQFMYVLSGWEGSAHDSKLLNDALSRRNRLVVPQGKYFLVDCGFANRRQFLAPLRGVRYHLKDFGGHGRHPRNASELFNLRHASLRNVIERIFGIFKSRFTIFKTAPPFPFQTQAELVLACAGLHNFLRKECRSDEFPIEYEEDQASPHLDMEDENHELLSQSQLQQRTEATAWRASIANTMWEMRPRYNDDNNEEGVNEDHNNGGETNEEHMDNEN